MTAQSKTVLKGYFAEGLEPTDAQFVDLIDTIPGDAGVVETDTAAILAAIAAHVADTDPHDDRAYADDQIAAHVADTDPHSDRAYTDAAILAGATGGATVSDQVLKAWTESKAFEMLTVTYDTTYPSLIASATVKWPDGSAGALTITATDTTKLVELSYTITHTASGKTVTQAAVTLNAAGFVTVKPALTVA